MEYKFLILQVLKLYSFLTLSFYDKLSLFSIDTEVLISGQDRVQKPKGFGYQVAQKL
jgi:hypothetical protein